MRTSCSAASALSAPGRFSTTTGWASCSESAWPMMRVVGSAEPPGGNPTIKRMGFDGYCASAVPIEHNNTTAADRSFFMVLSSAAILRLTYAPPRPSGRRDLCLRLERGPTLELRVQQFGDRGAARLVGAQHVRALAVILGRAHFVGE